MRAHLCARARRYLLLSALLACLTQRRDYAHTPGGKLFHVCQVFPRTRCKCNQIAATLFNGTTDCAAHPPVAHPPSIPQTIDNDIGLIDKSFGFDTAVEQALVPLTCAHTEALAAKNGALFYGCLRHSRPLMGAAVLLCVLCSPHSPRVLPRPLILTRLQAWGWSN